MPSPQARVTSVSCSNWTSSSTRMKNDWWKFSFGITSHWKYNFFRFKVLLYNYTWWWSCHLSRNSSSDAIFQHPTLNFSRDQLSCSAQLLTRADPGGQMLASLLKTMLQKNHLYFARYAFWTIWLAKEHLRATSELRSMTHLLLRFRAAFSQVQRDECSGFNLTWYCTYRMSEMILIVSL